MESRNIMIEAELGGLRRYARALARDTEAANDLVQETVASALRHWDKWRGDGALRAWLFTILRHRHIENARKQSRWSKITVQDTEAAEAQAGPDALDPIYVRDIAAAFADLPSEQRETLFLVAVEGMSYAETAEMTGAPVGTVMSRLARARRHLRLATGEEGQDD